MKFRPVLIILIVCLFIFYIVPAAIADSFDYSVSADGIYTTSSYAMGDVSGDDIITLRDVSMMFRWWYGANIELNLEKIDFNGDGISDLKDAAALFRFYSGNYISNENIVAEIVGNSLKITVNNTTAGNEYLLICRSGEASSFDLDKDVDSIVYVDQKTASGNMVTFNFKVPDDSSVFSAFVSSSVSSIEQKGYLTIPG